MACCSNELPPKCMKGLGKVWRDTGHNLVPAPPDKITETSFIDNRCFFVIVNFTWGFSDPA